MNGRESSPRISGLSWGKASVEGYPKPFKDVKVYPGGAREWDWNETGTRHEPGIQPADVRELLERGASVVILSTGMQERLRVCPETLQLLEEAGVTAYVLQSREAVQRFNQLRETEPVAILLHSTC
ncbi:MAG: Mth938-like domain-containing protein [Anaerolineaceae bacterium]|nr:MAG: Mth938-like domain-containing protein [Anaerolineaceae bacterium]